MYKLIAAYIIFSVIFSAVYLFIEIKKAKKKYADHHYLASIRQYLLSESGKRFKNTIYDMAVEIVLIFIVTAPILFPRYVFGTIKKLTGYKSPSDKAAEAEYESLKQFNKDVNDFTEYKNSGKSKATPPINTFCIVIINNTEYKIPEQVFLLIKTVSEERDYYKSLVEKAQQVN